MRLALEAHPLEDYETVRARAERLEVERNEYIRLFNRLDAAVTRHWRAKSNDGVFADHVDDGLHATHERILKARPA